jgi:XTP/dITP diphosphohydrolase
LDGIARSQPALALAAKVLDRARRAGLEVPLPAGDALGERLLRAVAEGGADAEGALRRAALAYAEAVRAAERSA